MTVAPVFLLGESSVEVRGGTRSGRACSGNLVAPGPPSPAVAPPRTLSNSRLSPCPGVPPPHLPVARIQSCLGPLAQPAPWPCPGARRAWRAALPSGPPVSPQYGKKKRRYLPYNHQHLYFFLSECPLVLLGVGAWMGWGSRRGLLRPLHVSGHPSLQPIRPEAVTALPAAFKSSFLPSVRASRALGHATLLGPQGED